MAPSMKPLVAGKRPAILRHAIDVLPPRNGRQSDASGNDEISCQGLHEVQGQKVLVSAETRERNPYSAIQNSDHTHGCKTNPLHRRDGPSAQGQPQSSEPDNHDEDHDALLKSKVLTNGLTKNLHDAPPAGSGRFGALEVLFSRALVRPQTLSDNRLYFVAHYFSHDTHAFRKSLAGDSRYVRATATFTTDSAPSF